MARTLSEIRGEARLMIGQIESDNSNFTNAQLNAWVNEAYRLTCVDLGVVPISESTYTLQTSITLDTDTISVDIAKILIQPQGDWRELEIIGLDDLLRMDPDWENADTGEPKYLVRTNAGAARLYPPPNAANDGQAASVKTYGLELPTNLSADSDVTALPHNLDDILAHYVAYRCFQRLNDMDRAVSELTLFRGQLKSHRQMATQFSRKRRKWRFAEVEND